MTHDTDAAILTIANSTQSEFVTALRSFKIKPNVTDVTQKPTPTSESLKMEIREAVMGAFDEVTQRFGTQELKDSDLPELFDCIDKISDRINARR